MKDRNQALMEPKTLEIKASAGKFGRKSEQELFLDRMEQVLPWEELLALVEPHFATDGSNRLLGEPSILLRTYFVKQWFNLSDSGAEEALYESPALCRFVGVDLNVAPAPDETAIRNFRGLLEEHDLVDEMLDSVKRSLDAQGIRVGTGTNGEATIVDAFSVDAFSRSGTDAGEALILSEPTNGEETPEAVYAPYRGEAEPQQMSTGRSRARVKDQFDPSFLGAAVLSVAVISPILQSRNAATTALDQCQSGPIREFTSYPPNLEDVPRMLNRDFDVVIVDLDSDPEYALELVNHICVNGLATVIVYSALADRDMLLKSMRAGAREFLPLPFEPGVMAEALVRASALRSAVRPEKKTAGCWFFSAPRAALE